ncbi:ABC transporter ATP-binding protein [Clostridium sp. SYSU_GA19001]|uniref:ABC transporter ATP-binding protein n=1 Tax=Clostridium caldaquaticum TaxID=2940653 RepID=UPI002076DC9B|nr:ABC transporter ATP-binding protein [Clostridium caldaquaticum]MCM8711310.1 ABC transporter ATP-binding protein [Clostridium caldaquaticum]
MVTLINVIKKFSDHTAVDNISFEANQGEFLTLLGPSGCGKTTTLRMIAGFEEPTSGNILLNGEDVSHNHPYERDVNTVFQNYALFPHMNIFENIAFGLKIKKLSKDDIKKKVKDALRLVRLEGYEYRMPNEISGGQKQRVAIARAIVNNPKVLLLDEPLGALDLKLRKEMQIELKHLQQKLGITFIYVTHDQEEALILSDRIAVMNKGKIEQIGVPNEIYERPKTKFVASFIGETNLFEATVDHISADQATLILETNNKIFVKDPSLKTESLSRGSKISIAIRPEKMKLSYSTVNDKNILTGKIKERIYVGSVNKTIVTLFNGKEVIINETMDTSLALNNKNSDVYVSWKYEDGVVIL